MSNPKRTVLYTGLTNNLERRVQSHKQKLNPQSFTARYNCNALIYFEVFDDINIAIGREKEIKGWKRIKKDRLIKHFNPQFKDWAADW